MLGAAVAVGLAALSAAAAPIELEVDLRDAPAGVVHARLGIPARPGPLTLVAPRWLPGDHRPSGWVAELASLQVSSGGKALAWARDPIDPYAFHVQVPPGAGRVDVAFDQLAPPAGQGSTAAASSFTSRLGILGWGTVLLHPAGVPVAEQPVRARVVLPRGWKASTALQVAARDGDALRFAPASLERLVDSPVLTGQHLVELPVGAAGAPPHLLVVAAESEEALVVPAELRAGVERLLAEASALFGAHPFAGYRFLISLSDEIVFSGLEHHECADIRLPERAFLDPAMRRARAGVLSHEYVHAWNGKYRRPAGMATADLQAPVDARLLWIYEGLTHYLGWVLSARSGLAGARLPDSIAVAAQGMASTTGRAWRSLEDTAAAAQVVYGARSEGAYARRSADFYWEGALVWLEVDALIRTRTRGARSLDDFVRRFLGGRAGPPGMVPYRLEDVLAELSTVAPLDWAAFFEARVVRPRPEAPVAGIEAAGWRLATGEAPTSLQVAQESASGTFNLEATLGLYLVDDRVVDVVPGSPAARAGISPGSRLVAVNGRKLTRQRLEDGLRATERGGPLELLVEAGERYRTHALAWRGGLRYPVLVRQAGMPDLLAAIAAPRAVAAVHAPAP